MSPLRVLTVYLPLIPLCCISRNSVIAVKFTKGQKRIGSRMYTMPKITCVKDGESILRLASNIAFSSTVWLAQATDEAMCQAKQKYSPEWR
ncbi:hypothetical protein NPIL_472431 [Nephila pilipes]|uniref:Uncharacterized protein n=1 Tax=Nephila pilipes TaxID=299642 RepID=A0A8X6TMJ9_NEPPI|nr:hypothetical protein NPIL_472431 [Nephila pilipes]